MIKKAVLTITLTALGTLSVNAQTRIDIYQKKDVTIKTDAHPGVAISQNLMNYSIQAQQREQAREQQRIARERLAAEERYRQQLLQIEREKLRLLQEK